MVAKHASLAQSAERVTFNHVVASSSLARGDIVFLFHQLSMLTPCLRSSCDAAKAAPARMLHECMMVKHVEFK